MQKEEVETKPTKLEKFRIEMNPISSLGLQRHQVARQSRESSESVRVEAQQSRQFLLNTGTHTPLKRSDRKKFQRNAQFYSECCLAGIEPAQADLAALSADSQYKRWWVDVKYKESDQKESRAKRRKLSELKSRSTVDNGEGYTREPHDFSAAVVSSEEESLSKKAPPRRIEDEGISPGVHQQLSMELVPAVDISKVKASVIDTLRQTGGDSSTPQFLAALPLLIAYYTSRGFDERWTDVSPPVLAMDGKWTTISKPTFSECQGRNERGGFKYSLGRVAFDMFRPTTLMCSLNASYNVIGPWEQTEKGRPLYFPLSIRKESSHHSRKPRMRNYDIEIALTIEAGQTRRGVRRDKAAKEETTEYLVRRPINCLLTNHGYVLPDPEVKNRLSVWFTGGSLEMRDDADKLDEWKELFDPSSAPRRDLAETARVLAARILVGAHLPQGMSEDGKMTYTLRRPIGGHGQVFCDVLFADDSLRILRGHRGSLFVSTKLPM